MTDARDGFAAMLGGDAVRQDRLHPLMTHVHLLTGAGSGIGAVLAERLLERGDDLVLLARSTERAHELRERAARARPCWSPTWPTRSRSSRSSCPTALDSVVHAAGVVELGPVAELSRRDWAEQLAVNLVAPAALTRVALPGAARGPRHRGLRQLRRRA